MSLMLVVLMLSIALGVFFPRSGSRAQVGVVALAIMTTTLYLVFADRLM